MLISFYFSVDGWPLNGGENSNYRHFKLVESPGPGYNV